ncbi:TVP38/TMEM64 family protein [Pseudobacillus wudalianchiensis]|uniref:TVP38/TMEM64 family membrane protein n=1 Tax=Pseudobacillus wudalianchiensis TaxID=1743143 RepID=A0A1B9AFY9_9BACI|nr:VTT domain-containing protein [Bacillus wudalianchiensis]OCA82756.1 hypothetical protein A8F95_13495 [Bacillus wudalianchiensis]
MKKKVLVVAIWILLIYVLKQNHLLSPDLDRLKELISENSNYAMLLFVALWGVRLLIFIPGITLMVLGGICFEPLLGFLLSMAGIILSETLVYIFSKTFIGMKLNKFLKNKSPKLRALLKTYNYKFLALGIVCPIASTDAICFLSASLGLKYTTYMLTIIVANIPMTLLYGFIGPSLNGSLLGITAVVMIFIIVTIMSVNAWNKLNKCDDFAVKE